MSLELRVDKDLSLHLLEPQDAAEIFAVIEANREHISAWLPWPNTTRCEQDLADFAGQNLSDFSTRKAMTLVIRERGQVVGGVGWTDWRMGERFGCVVDGSADIGYWLARHATGRGIMTRCVARLLEEAFQKYDLFRVTIRAEPGNEASNAVPRRLGFVHEGTLRHVARWKDRWVDHHLWAMTREDWQARSSERRLIPAPMTPCRESAS